MCEGKLRQEVSWSALALCILAPALYTPEQAFQILAPEKKRRLTDQKVKEMVEMKRSMSYRELSKIYNIPRGTIHYHIKKYEQAMTGRDKNAETGMPELRYGLA
ncbi:MAG: hypothetical protein FH756_01685 [Firmicutes bacterium]|nr:hypothetical protein [Bacillota bacterium]